eukprot:360854-Rhodomonas_salina.1
MSSLYVRLLCPADRADMCGAERGAAAAEEPAEQLRLCTRPGASLFGGGRDRRPPHVGQKPRLERRTWYYATEPSSTVI